jgi:peroxiredoxin Q/BCP
MQTVLHRSSAPAKTPPRQHEKFITNTVLKKLHCCSIADGDVCERYGVWGEKKM